MKKIILLVLLLLNICYVNAQEKEVRREIKELKRIIEDLHFQNKYRESLRFMVRLDAIDKEEIDLDRKYLIAKLYIAFTQTKIKAKPYLEAYMKGTKKPDEQVYYYLGKVQHLSNEFDKAINSYNLYLANTKKSDERIPEIKRAIECCVNAKDLIQNPVNVIITNIGPVINTEWPEYVPVISADESVLYFTSRRPNSKGGLMNLGGEPDSLGEYFEDIYVSVNINEKWSKPVTAGSNINTNAHDADIALSADGQKLFVYRSDSVKWGNIFLCDLNGFEWSKPVWMDMGKNAINTKDWWEGSCSLSGDENILFFATNREGGYGGRDIYMVRKLPDGKWAMPKNLGPTINTPYNDDQPFFHPDGRTLYFSSEGFNSMGGYDIFRTTMNDDGTWTKPENVGYPINSSDNDRDFVLAASGERGYYSSYKVSENYGDLDIYVINFPKEVVKAVAKPLTLLKGSIKSCKPTNKIVATITLTDNETQTKVGEYKPNTATGKYLILVPPGKNYSITIESQGHLFYSENVFVPEQTEFVEIVKDIQLECVEVGSRIVLRNIFYDFDKATLRPESKTELDKLLKLLAENPKLVVELSGHTDAKGSDEYNIKLSQNRAQSVVDYLIKAGIPPRRMIAKGYGERLPIALNVNLDGTDNPEGRQLNRRTELKILGIEGENISVEKIQVPDALKISDISEVQQAEAAANPQGTVIYKIQIAASKTNIPMEYFLGFNNLVSEKGSDGMIRYTSGSFTDVKEAIQYRNEIVEKKIIANPFIIAFKDGLRLSAEETKKLVEGK